MRQRETKACTLARSHHTRHYQGCISRGKYSRGVSLSNHAQLTPTSIQDRLRINHPQEAESNDDDDFPLNDEKDQANDTTPEDDNNTSSASSPEERYEFSFCHENDMHAYLLFVFHSQKLEVVHKESFFSEELTEEEKILVAKRVAQHQQQFAAYERRERARKAKKIRAIFDHVDNEEISAMLRDCDNDEVCLFVISRYDSELNELQQEEVVYCLTQPGYLHEIRKSVASKYVDETYQKSKFFIKRESK